MFPFERAALGTSADGQCRTRATTSPGAVSPGALLAPAPRYARSVARIPLPDPEDVDVDPGIREVLSAWQDPTSSGSSGGTQRIPNVMRAMANHPGLMRNRGIVYTPQARITPRQRELAYLTASVINNCHY